MNKKGKSIFAVMFLAMLVGNYFQYQLSPIAGRLMESLNLTQTQFSSIFSSPMVPAILFGIVAGILTDRFGIKKVCGGAIVLATLGLCYRPFAANYETFFAAMFLGGLGTTLLNVNVAKIMGRYYPPEKIGSMVGMVMMGSTLGMALATSTTAAFPSVKMALIVAAVGEVIVLLLWFLVMDSDAQKGTAASEMPQVSLVDSIRVVVKCKYIWVLGVCMMCILGCNTALGSFIPMALQSRGISEASAGLVVTGMMLGNFAGAFAGPRLVERSKNKKMLIAALGILAAVTAAFSWRLPEAMAFVGLLACGFGMGSLLPVYMSMPVQLKEIGPAYAGTAGGVTSTLELLGAVVIPTYIITPLAGTNFTLFFLLTGCCMVIMAAVAFLLPND